jgi:hypothetical protein
MAKTRVKPAHDIAKGNAPNTGAPGPTPAPTRPSAPDVISAPRKGTAAGYGMNSDAGPVAIAPGATRQSPLADNLRASVDDDGVLDRVQRDGTARPAPDWQTRTVSDKGNPAAHGMASRQSNSGSPGGTIPAKIGASSAPVPGYGRKA